MHPRDRGRSKLEEAEREHTRRASGIELGDGETRRRRGRVGHEKQHSEPNRSTSKSVMRRHFWVRLVLYETRMKIRPRSVIFVTPCLSGSGYPDREDFRVTVQADRQGQTIAS